MQAEPVPLDGSCSRPWMSPGVSSSGEPPNALYTPCRAHARGTNRAKYKAPCQSVAILGLEWKRLLKQEEDIR
jgi:hypothetical protein